MLIFQGVVINTQNPANLPNLHPPQFLKAAFDAQLFARRRDGLPEISQGNGPRRWGFCWANRNVGHPEMAKPDESHALFQLLRFALNPQPFPLLNPKTQQRNNGQQKWSLHWSRNIQTPFVIQKPYCLTLIHKLWLPILWYKMARSTSRQYGWE